MERFTIRVAPEVLDDLRSRLARTRWPDEVEDAGWDYGTNLDYLKELVDYWVSDFDWPAQESLLNSMPQWRTRLDRLAIHFVHAEGHGPDPFPIVMSHGWPSSFFEMHKIIGPLTDPAAFGGEPEDAFHVVVPSLPGFGFSERPRNRRPVATDELWRVLMTDVLGYERFGACGGDVGARITSALGRFHGDVVAAIHLESVHLDWPDPLPEDLVDAERNYLDRVGRWEEDEGGYSHLQSTRPQTVAYGLNDSPTGLAAWIVEKYRAWSDCGGDVESRFSKDELLTNVMIYWLTETIGSSMRRYFDARHASKREPSRQADRVETATGIAMFPGEAQLVVPREFAERSYHVTRWTDMPSGGHFPALEEPDLLVADIRAFFADWR